MGFLKNIAIKYNTHPIYNLKFAMVCSSSLLFSASYNMLIPELPAYLSSLGGAKYIGLIIALFTLTAGISRPFSGRITDTVGRVPVMVFGALVCVLCGMLYPVLNTVVGNKASVATRESFRKRLRNGDLDKNEIEINVQEGPSMPSFEIPGMPGANVGMVNIGEMLGKTMGKKPKKKKMTVKESHEILIAEESDKLIEQDKIVKSAKVSTENNGIVFLDEIDKVSARSDRIGGDVSREGVQRDLLPLIEGTTVSTKYGTIKTDHILFIASGAFQLAKPSDLLPELQGRLPIRVELNALTSEDFKKILREPDNSLIKQYKALLKTEKINLEFTDDGIETIAELATEVNSSVENIGARRLHTIIEKVLDEISFTATDRSGEKITIDKKYVQKNLGELVKDTDLSKFIL